jgi:hypothetical protein
VSVLSNHAQFVMESKEEEVRISQRDFTLKFQRLLVAWGSE